MIFVIPNNIKNKFDSTKVHRREEKLRNSSHKHVDDRSDQKVSR